MSYHPSIGGITTKKHIGRRTKNEDELFYQLWHWTYSTSPVCETLSHPWVTCAPGRYLSMYIYIGNLINILISHIVTKYLDLHRCLLQRVWNEAKAEESGIYVYTYIYIERHNIHNYKCRRTPVEWEYHHIRYKPHTIYYLYYRIY